MNTKNLSLVERSQILMLKEIKDLKFDKRFYKI